MELLISSDLEYFSRNPLFLLMQVSAHRLVQLSFSFERLSSNPHFSRPAEQALYKGGKSQ
jgi:hypothetical protein